MQKDSQSNRKFTSKKEGRDAHTIPQTLRLGERLMEYRSKTYGSGVELKDHERIWAC